ncbi:MAG: hypothetical protein EBU90_13885 [Proteobacteria bacterium]|nr:hypothetical protein [Pseudomonadota bacterium]
MTERDEAIVLATTKQKISLLSRSKGRIDALFFLKPETTAVRPGSLISYYCSYNSYGWLVLQESSVEHVPLDWARKDIDFLHYILEFCYFFIPLGADESEIFRVIKQLYTNFYLFETQLHKKVLLCIFLAHLGLYPDDETIRLEVGKVLEIPIDKITTIDLQLIVEDTLEQWIAWSIFAYPHGKWLKAMPLLLKK